MAEVSQICEEKVLALSSQGEALQASYRRMKQYIGEAARVETAGLTEMRDLRAGLCAVIDAAMDLAPVEDAALHFNIDEGLLLALPALGQVDHTRTYAPLCTVRGEGLAQAWRGRTAIFTVHTHDRHGGSFEEGRRGYVRLL